MPGVMTGTRGVGNQWRPRAEPGDRECAASRSDAVGGSPARQWGCRVPEAGVIAGAHSAPTKAATGHDTRLDDCPPRGEASPSRAGFRGIDTDTIGKTTVPGRARCCCQKNNCGICRREKPREGSGGAMFSDELPLFHLATAIGNAARERVRAEFATREPSGSAEGRYAQRVSVEFGQGFPRKVLRGRLRGGVCRERETRRHPHFVLALCSLFRYRNSLETGRRRRGRWQGAGWESIGTRRRRSRGSCSSSR